MSGGGAPARRARGSSTSAGALAIEGLRVSFPGVAGSERREVLRGISLELTPGRVTGLAGESGSGKSMTALAICGLLPEGAQASGRIAYDGVDLLGLSEKQLAAYRGRRLGMVFQDPTASLHPMLTIETQLTDHVRHHLRVGRREARERAVALLREVHVPEPVEALRKYPHQFSGGQLQRVAIAVAMACEPDVLIADEPTTALDVTVQAGVLRLLRELVGETGISVLLITHDLGVMSAVADDVVVLKDGGVVEAGLRSQVLTAPAHPYTKALLDALPAHERPGGLGGTRGATAPGREGR